ncbi:MAG TPA: DUF222 domain-containing protein, partial [Kineosporiaceae bacterium]|nr:DUF222 domain-containing protein [Kineosporiaceae bacterium]
MFESVEVAAVLGAIPDHELDDVLESILEADLIATGTVEECGLALNRWATRTGDQPPPPDPPEWVLFPPAAIDPTELTGEPGARLADVLSGLLHRAPDLSGSGLTDGELVEYVAAAERLSRWAQWMRGTGILALRHRWATTDPTDPTDPTENPASTDAPDPAGTAEAGTAEHERARRLAGVERRERRHSPLAYGPADSDLAEAFAVSETALAAGVSETMARQWLRIAAALTDRLPICSGALRAGRLDWSKIRAVAEVTDGRTTAITRAAEALVLPDALLPGPGDSRSPGDHRGGPVIRTVPDLKNRLRAALLLLDAAGEADAAARERDTRRVACRAISPSMGELLATLPLDQIALIAARLDHAVIVARRARDPRTADHVRADTLTDLLTRGLIPDDGESSTAAAGADADRPDPDRPDADRPDPDRPDADRPGTAPPSSGPDPSTGTAKRSAHDGSPAGDPLADADPDEARAGATDADPDAATDSDTTEPADFPDPRSPASRGGDSRPQP